MRRKVWTPGDGSMSMSNPKDWLVLVVVLVVVLVAALALVIATVVLAFANEFRAALLCSAVANCLLMLAVRVKR